MPCGARSLHDTSQSPRSIAGGVSNACNFLRQAMAFSEPKSGCTSQMTVALPLPSPPQVSGDICTPPPISAQRAASHEEEVGTEYTASGSTNRPPKREAPRIHPTTVSGKLYSQERRPLGSDTTSIQHYYYFVLGKLSELTGSRQERFLRVYLSSDVGARTFGGPSLALCFVIRNRHCHLFYSFWSTRLVMY
jgi:hypothetical protein